MKKYTVIILIVVVALILGVVYLKSERIAQIDSFTACADAGFPILESYPRQCRTPDGRSFVEDISGSKANLIRVTNPKPGQIITSPLTVEGEARGTWFFEASFPVKLYDGEGRELIAVPAQAEGDWMTEDFVPFKVTFAFAATSGPGVLVLEKDNPSGLPEYDDSLTIPVVFKDSGIPLSMCKATGCSSQICSDEDVVTTCEFREEYACYKKAVCQRQASGQCGWTETAEFSLCMQNI